MKKFRKNDFKQKIKQHYLTLAFLCISVLILSFNIAYAASGKNGQDFYPKSGDNKVTINVSGPSGTSSIQIGFLFNNTEISYDSTHNRAWFRKGIDGKGRQVKLYKKSGGGGPYNLSFSNVVVRPTLDGGDVDKNGKVIKGTQGYTIVTFTVYMAKPAHQKFDKGAITGDGPGRFKRDFTNKDNHDAATVAMNFEINLSNTGLIDDSQGNRHDNVVYTANFQNYGTHTLTLNDPLLTNQTFTYNDGDTQTLSDHSKDGYKFNGWYEGSTKYNSIQMCANHTLTAQWTAYQHKVNYDLQGGNFPESLKNQTELSGCKIIPNGTYYLRSGLGSGLYIHINHPTNYENTSDDVLDIWNSHGPDVTQSQWIFTRYKNTQYYNIVSIHNGLAMGLSGNPSQDQTNKSLELWNEEKDVIDYQWYLKDEGNGQVAIYNRSTNQCLDVAGANTKPGTLLQQYNPNHSNAQKWTLETMSQQDYPTKLKYAAHNLVTPTISPQRGNDKFLGWSTDPNATTATWGADVYYTNIGDTNVTLYAIYQKRTKINYDANGGKISSSLKSTIVNTGEKLTLPDDSALARGYYKLIGWSTDSHAKKNYEQPGAEVTINDSGEITYYAIWQSVNGNSDLANVITGNGMFTNDSNLEGQNGTIYNSLHDGLDYAHPDGGVDDPGYYHEK